MGVWGKVLFEGLELGSKGEEESSGLGFGIRLRLGFRLGLGFGLELRIGLGLEIVFGL